MQIDTPLIHLENSENNISMKLGIVDYQFPEQIGSYWDNNWLNIRVTVKQNSKLFDKVDATLVTKDLTRIYAWFEALANSNLPDYAVLDFIEPCLGFSFLAKTATEVRISVNLSHECKPKFRLNQFKIQSNRWNIFFGLSESDFENILKNLRKAIQSYPVRN
ncbi:MAG: hypothetical protein KBA66_15180 [Leptospiraceae bacterium]|nr:hypothetical protein [Leptospiraceae bacterium]